MKSEDLPAKESTKAERAAPRDLCFGYTLQIGSWLPPKQSHHTKRHISPPTKEMNLFFLGNWKRAFLNGRKPTPQTLEYKLSHRKKSQHLIFCKEPSCIKRSLNKSFSLLWFLICSICSSARRCLLHWSCSRPEGLHRGKNTFSNKLWASWRGCSSDISFMCSYC